MSKLPEWVETSSLDTRVQYHEDQQTLKTLGYYNEQKFLHRHDGPAWQEWKPDGTKLAEEWHVDGKRHREDGPAVLEWRANGTLRRESWYTQGTLVWEMRSSP